MASAVSSAAAKSTAMSTLVNAGVPWATATKISSVLAATGTTSIGSSIVAGAASLWALSPVLAAVAGFLAAAVAALIVFGAVKGGVAIVKKLISTFTKAREEIPAEVTESVNLEGEMKAVYERTRRPKDPKQALGNMEYYYEKFYMSLVKAKKHERKMPKRAQRILSNLNALARKADRDMDKLRKLVA